MKSKIKTIRENIKKLLSWLLAFMLEKHRLWAK